MKRGIPGRLSITLAEILTNGWTVPFLEDGTIFRIFQMR